MYILQLSQGELSINVGLFHTIEEGRKAYISISWISV